MIVSVSFRMFSPAALKGPPYSALQLDVRLEADATSFCRSRLVDVVLRNRLTRANDSLLRVFRERLVFDALRAQGVRHGVVALEALIGQQLVSRRRDERK